jgi:hypothetical protein
MLAVLILFLAAAVVAFGLALLFRRAAAWIAWIVGSLPAALLAVESRETLANPLTILFILIVIWLPTLAGAFTGAALARRLAARRNRAPAPSS